MANTEAKIAVIGLGYVGLPGALAFAKNFSHVLAFDIDTKKIEQLKAAVDDTGLGLEEDLRTTSLKFSANERDLASCDFFIIAVPTPVDEHKKPDLSCLINASEMVARNLGKGSTIVFESTVYPGVTEEVCAPVIENVSGLKRGVDFKLAYAPERINPGDPEHSLGNVVKVISGEDEETLERVAEVYQSIIKAGLHYASSIKVAEAAKVIENTQRDLNIALMNELALIFDRIGISTSEVIEAASTKWNFLKFTPGLVGGHCIGVDPYYLTSKAEQMGYTPQVILAGRKINDRMGTFVAQKTVKLMTNSGVQVKDSKVAVLGVAFKENVPDTRNSRVPDIVEELKSFGVDVQIHDPLVDTEHYKAEQGIALCDFTELSNLDAVILAVPHKEYQARKSEIRSLLKKGGVLVDIKSIFSEEELPDSLIHWSL